MLIHEGLLVKDFCHGNGMKRTSYYLEKQVDGFFCTDGILLYNHKKDRSYVLFLSNRYLFEQPAFV